jgi:FkbM family methyltransferase
MNELPTAGTAVPLSAGLRVLRATTARLYRMRGFARVAERVRIANARRRDPIVVDDFDGDSKFTCYLHSHIGSFVFWRGWYSREQLRLLDGLLSPDAVFFDIGANEGEHTVFAARRLTRGRVFSFEPVASVHERLRANVELNGFGNVELVRKGLGDSVATLPIYGGSEPAADGTVNEGLPTLYPTAERSQLLEVIEIVPLDDFIEEAGVVRLDAMKIDVEGAELTILSGGRRSIERFRPVILLEVSEETSRAAGYPARSLLDFLVPLGYRFESFGRNGRMRPVTPGTIGEYQDVVCYPGPRTA